MLRKIHWTFMRSDEVIQNCEFLSIYSAYLWEEIFTEGYSFKWHYLISTLPCENLPAIKLQELSLVCYWRAIIAGGGELIRKEKNKQARNVVNLCLGYSQRSTKTKNCGITSKSNLHIIEKIFSFDYYLMRT